MKFVNGWNAFNKQYDKIDITLRVSFLTIFSLKIDVSDDTVSFTLFNFAFKSK
jgi:hypothetical protein